MEKAVAADRAYSAADYSGAAALYGETLELLNGLAAVGVDVKKEIQSVATMVATSAGLVEDSKWADWAKSTIDAAPHVTVADIEKVIGVPIDALADPVDEQPG